MYVETFHEFCFIIWHFVPQAYRLHVDGQLTGTRSKMGTSSLFFFSPNHVEENKHNWHMPNFGPYYTHGNSTIQQLVESGQWKVPDYKGHFKNDMFVYDKPILTINNKSTIEWERGIYNYINRESLRELCKTFYDDYQIVYIKPPTNTRSDYQHDSGVRVEDIGEYEMFREEFPGVLTISDLSEQHPEIPYNQLQMMLLANSDHHIASAGGEAAIASYFGGDLLIYRHPTAPSHNRGVWHTGSYLKQFSGANVIGVDQYYILIEQAKELWS